MVPIEPWRNSTPIFGAAAFCTTKTDDFRASLTLLLRSLGWPRSKVKMHNVGTVPTFKMHNVGTVPTYRMHNIGTVPTYKTHNIGTELSYATLKLELD